MEKHPQEAAGKTRKSKSPERATPRSLQSLLKALRPDSSVTITISSLETTSLRLRPAIIHLLWNVQKSGDVQLKLDFTIKQEEFLSAQLPTGEWTTCASSGKKTPTSR